MLAKFKIADAFLLMDKVEMQSLSSTARARAWEARLSSPVEQMSCLGTRCLQVPCLSFLICWAVVLRNTRGNEQNVLLVCSEV